MATITSAPTLLVVRHIQNFSEAKTLQHHWGYADRALPCTNDAGSCEYLDVVYQSHDLGMWYVGIIWATLVGVLLFLVIGRTLRGRSLSTHTAHLRTSKDVLDPPKRRYLQRIRSTASAFVRRYFLRQSGLRIFGHASRLQVLILALLIGYLTIWSFVGITYKRWITPVKAHPGVYNTRTSLGPWSDRVGVLAFALTPLSVMLSSRESILSLATGIPYQNFNFLHRWLGYIIVVQSTMHTIGWCIIEGKLYQPQPTVGKEWITQLYMIWGIVAMILVAFLFVFSWPPVIRFTGYEFFRKSHYIIAMLYIGACWGHWAKLNCFMIASLVVWSLDRGMRFLRTALLHYNCIGGRTTGFRAISTAISHFPDEQNGDVVRLDFVHRTKAWDVGQHFYLCFPELSIWQSHPFTPASVPNAELDEQSHSYIIRAQKGETRKLSILAAAKAHAQKESTTSAILMGPYGENSLAGLSHGTSVLCIAGGTGITFVLPILLHLISLPPSQDRKLELVWAIRRKSDTNWIGQELELLQEASKKKELALSIRIFVTRESNGELAADHTIKPAMIVQEKPASFVSSSSEVNITTTESAKHPKLAEIMEAFTDATVRGATRVYASGPSGMLGDTRTAVATMNSARRVWNGDDRGIVELVCDDRLEW